MRMHLSLPPLVLLGTLLAGCSTADGQAADTADTVPDGRARVTVDGDGYHPGSLEVAAGRPLTITFERTTDQTCGHEVVFPSLGIRRELPLREPVDVQLTPTSGTIAFTCGMGMYRGSIVAR
jgi:plastocyanin domain-containing protein